MKLSIAQIQNLMRQAGWPEDLIVTGSAVFYFESAHGDPYAHKVDSVERSYGLAQVNRNAWPQFSVDQLYDPLLNLQVAYDIYRQQGWRAWQNTYYGGRYKPFLAESQAVYYGGSAANENAAASVGDNFFGIPVDYGIDGPVVNEATDTDLSLQSSMFGGSTAGVIAVALLAVVLIPRLFGR